MFRDFINLDESLRFAYSVSSSTLQSMIDQVPESHFKVPIEELQQLAKNSGSFSLELLRNNFWVMCEKIQGVYGIDNIHEAPKIEVKDIVKGVMTDDMFYRGISVNAARLAYILRPYPEHKAEMHRLLRKLITKLDEIMDLPLIDQKGKPDWRGANLLLRVYTLIDNRLHGGVVQRVEQKNLNLSIDRTIEGPRGIHDIDTRIKDIEQQLRGGAEQGEDRPAKVTAREVVVVGSEVEDAELSSTSVRNEALLLEQRIF